jgi:hypothetical protein
MTGATETRLDGSTLSAEPYHNPKNSMARPWCVTEWNGRMSITHRFSTLEAAEAWIDQQDG